MNILEILQNLIIDENINDYDKYKQLRDIQDLVSWSVDIVKQSILDDPSFKNYTGADYNIKKASRKTFTLSADAIVPDDYKTKVLDFGKFQKEEPKEYQRLSDKLISDYPEYSQEKIDEKKLQADLPDLFIPKITEYITLTKITPTDIKAVEAQPSKVWNIDLPF